MVNVITNNELNNNYSSFSNFAIGKFLIGLIGNPFSISLNGFETYSPENGKRLYIFRVANSAATINGIYMDN